MVQWVGKLCSSLPWDIGAGCIGLQNDGMYSWNKIHLWLLNTKDFPLGEEDLETQFNGGLENILGKCHCLLTSSSCLLLHICCWPFLETRYWAGWISGLSWYSCLCLKMGSGEDGGDVVVQIRQLPPETSLLPVSTAYDVQRWLLDWERGLLASVNILAKTSAFSGASKRARTPLKIRSELSTDQSEIQLYRTAH